MNLCSHHCQEFVLYLKASLEIYQLKQRYMYKIWIEESNYLHSLKIFELVMFSSQGKEIITGLQGLDNLLFFLADKLPPSMW